MTRLIATLAAKERLEDKAAAKAEQSQEVIAQES